MTRHHCTGDEDTCAYCIRYINEAEYARDHETDDTAADWEANR